MKTAYCISCDKILGKLFCHKFAKCDICQKITKSYSKELVETESKSSFFNENKKNIDEDIQKVFDGRGVEVDAMAKQKEADIMSV